MVLLNIFFGIIIDTFGKLRNLKVEREVETANKCFICGVDSHDFMKDGTSTGNISFKQHREVRHNMWNYLYFAMHLWQQPREKDSSVEMTVRQCMENGDVSWFPIGYHEMNMDDDSDDECDDMMMNNNEHGQREENEGGGGRKGKRGSVSRGGKRFKEAHFHSGRQMSSSLNLMSSFDSSSHMKYSNSTTTAGTVFGPSHSSDSYDKDMMTSDRLLRMEIEKMTEMMTEKINQLQDTIQQLSKQSQFPQHQQSSDGVPSFITSKNNSPTITRQSSRKLSSLPPLDIPSNTNTT